MVVIHDIDCTANFACASHARSVKSVDFISAQERAAHAHVARQSEDMDPTEAFSKYVGEAVD